MIELNDREALVYRCLLLGMKDAKTVKEATGKSDKSVRAAIEILDSHGMVTITKKVRSLTFRPIEKEYVSKKKSRAMDEGQISADGIPRGQFDLTGYSYPFTDQQKKAIEIYKKGKMYKGERMERTSFARAIGVPKLHVNFALGATR